MDVLGRQEILAIADDLFASHTGKHFNDLQKKILLRTLEGKTYLDIANETHHTEKYIKETGGKLWKSLSKALGEKVNKSNIRATIERFHNSLSKSNIIQSFQIHNSNIWQDYGTHNNDAHLNNNHQASNASYYEDLSDVPVYENFYGREKELNFLEQKIITENYRLISILGINGIGKTALTVQLINKIKHHFNYVIYKSLSSSPTCTELHNKIFQFIGNSKKQFNNVSLSSYLRQYRCLIILDDLEFLFASENYAGTYKDGYKDYDLFFKTIANNHHQSCVILLSSQNNRQIELLETSNSSSFSLLLTGLGTKTKQILHQNNLQQEEHWDKLISIYNGHPLYLEITAKLIQYLFLGKVLVFLNEEESFLHNDIVILIQETLKILSPSETRLIEYLAQQSNPLSIPEIKNKTSLSTSVIINGIQSLKRRFLLETEAKNDHVRFQVIPLIKQYIKSIQSTSNKQTNDE
ncbi:NB-ARC domain-containing protein [Crocosphaera sp.]|uniref:NB-ARC domain-containing protein n=1 Tax=Crocosphaera sp. TaxID=2729996 RepID=UPI00262DD013|nr:NB-ARC domain-containing protein [Crocosphaera sp.]MDJ0578545.1 NB-ARC domain-containing protein [Crocosphaera sp.]